MSLERAEKFKDIQEYLEKDLLGADLKLSLFVSAAKSFKKNFFCNPFPHFHPYLDEKGNKDFNKLLEDLDTLPSLEEILILIYANNNDTQIISQSALELLHWILVQNIKYDVETIEKSKHEEVLTLSKSSGTYQKPNYIFKIHYNGERLNAEKKFHQLKNGKETNFAYHGTKFSIAYSILNFGLQQHLNKTGLFGEGLYFSFELQVSSTFTQSVLGWNKSKLGELISCVAICEYINDPSYFKIRKENAKNLDIPQSYLLITNNEIVRVRYLIIYGTKKALTKTNSNLSKANVNDSATSSSMMSQIMTWIRRNPLIVSAILYVVLLMLVGFSNHRSVEHYKKLIMHFLRKRFKFE